MSTFIERAEYDRDIKTIIDILERMNSVSGSVEHVVHNMVDLHEKTMEVQRLQLDLIKYVAVILFCVVVLLLGYIFRSELRRFIEWVRSYLVVFWGLTKKEKLTGFFIPIFGLSLLTNAAVLIHWLFRKVTGL